MLRRVKGIVTRGLVLVVLGCLMMGLAGCCGRHTKKDFGRSVTHNLATQLVNPEAGARVQVSAGMAPEAAVNAYEKYLKSFKAEEKRPFLKLTTEEK